MASNRSVSSPYTTPPNSQGDQHFPSNPETTSSSNVSPMSPRSRFTFSNLPLATRQLRPPKSPLYIPAVLRPTERPHRPSLLTPPHSINNSTDSLHRNDGREHLIRRSTGDAWGETTLRSHQSLGPVEGLPTRSHWKPDSNAVLCDAPTCQKAFSIFERRHHCRHCGHVFCAAHSPYTIPLDHRAEFHPDGTCSRACKHCWDRYCSWNSKRLSSADEEVETRSGRNIEGRAIDRDGQRSLAGSMPRDWNWSTF